MTSILVIETADGFPLGARVFSPEGAPRATVLVHAATATPARYYTAFASALAESGFRVITYDYRGIGESRPASLASFRATMTDWAKKDAAAATQAALSFPEPVLLVGHSFGGQLLGLIDTPARVKGIALVGAQLGYVGHWPLTPGYLYTALWRAMVPAVVGTLGYMPGSLGLDVDLPGGVAREWARWCSSPGYLLDHHADAANRFASIDRPTLLYSFTDDTFAARPAVNAYIDLFRGTRVIHRRFSPAELGETEINHFGFFRRGIVPALWEETIDFFDAVLLDERPALSSRAGWDVAMEDIVRDLAYGRT